MWFGERWDAPAVEDGEQFPEVPTYVKCSGWCDEQIQDGDQGYLIPLLGAVPDPEYLVGVASGATLTAVHRECLLATTVGHMVGVCVCRGFERNRAAALECWRRVTELGTFNDVQHR